MAHQPEITTYQQEPKLKDSCLVFFALEEDCKAAAETKLRLDAFVSSKVPEVSRGVIAKWIRNDQVRINGKVCSKPGRALHVADIVGCNIPAVVVAQTIEKSSKRSLPARENVPVLDQIEVLFENEDLFVFSKPPDLTVHPGAGTDCVWTFTDELARRYPEMVQAFSVDPQGSDQQERPGLVHRLDKDTSGAIIVAKNLRSLRFLQSCFADRSIKRFYVCLMDGVLPEPRCTVETLNKRSPSDRKKFIVVRDLQKDGPENQAPSEVRGAKRACSHFQQLRAYEDRLSLCRVRLDTGRTHQIRVHAAHLRRWVLGDQLYGRPFQGASKLGSVAGQLAAFKRQFLHAYRVVIPMPDGSEPISIYAPPSPDMLPILSSLGLDQNQLQELLTGSLQP